MRAREHRDGVELHGAEAAQHRRRPAAAPVGAQQALRAQGGAPRLVAGQRSGAQAAGRGLGQHGAGARVDRQHDAALVDRLDLVGQRDPQPVVDVDHERVEAVGVADHDVQRADLDALARQHRGALVERQIGSGGTELGHPVEITQQAPRPSG